MLNHNDLSIVYLGRSSSPFLEVEGRAETDFWCDRVIDQNNEFDQRLLRLAEKVASRRSSPRQYEETSRSIWVVRRHHRPLPKLNERPLTSAPSSKPDGTAPFPSTQKRCQGDTEKSAFIAEQPEHEHEWESLTVSTASLTPPTSPERTKPVAPSSSLHHAMLDGDRLDAGDTKPPPVQHKHEKATPSATAVQSHRSRSCESQKEHRQREPSRKSAKASPAFDRRAKDIHHNIDYFFSILADEPLISGNSRSRGGIDDLYYAHIPVSPRTRRSRSSSGASSKLYAYSELSEEDTTSSSSRRRGSAWSSLATVLGYSGVNEQSSSCPSQVETSRVSEKKRGSSKKKKNHSTADVSWYLVTSSTPVLPDNPSRHTMVMVFFDSEEQATTVRQNSDRGNEIFDAIEEECEEQDESQQGQEAGASQEREDHDEGLGTPDVPPKSENE